MIFYHPKNLSSKAKIILGLSRSEVVSCAVVYLICSFLKINAIASIFLITLTLLFSYLFKILLPPGFLRHLKRSKELEIKDLK